MRVLAIDPGLTRCGVAVVDGSASRRVSMVHVEVVRTQASDSIGRRLIELDQHFADALDAYQPDVVAIERVFSQHNVRTVMGTAQSSAVAIVAATRRGIPVAMHTPSEVKAAVTGSGRADKAQVALMVVKLLKLTSVPKPADATDALALAICHLWRGDSQRRLDLAVQTQAAARGRAGAVVLR